jgi:hypothetical protein
VFWREVVAVLTDGKKLRRTLPAKSLGRGAGTIARGVVLRRHARKQRELCPKRRGGSTDGSLPTVGLLSEISQAMREVNVLRALQRQDLIAAATKDRCGSIGLDPQLTNAVVRIVGEEALRQQAENQVGDLRSAPPTCCSPLKGCAPKVSWRKRSSASKNAPSNGCRSN